MNPFMLVLSLLVLPAVSFAQDAEEPEAIATESAASSTVSTDAPSATKAKVKRKDRPKAEKRLKSQFTSDKTEEEADHRVLDPIAMGMDKIVDIEGDVVTDTKLITVGNPSVVAQGPILTERGDKKFVKQMIFKGVGEGESNVIVRAGSNGRVNGREVKRGDVLIIFDVTVAKQNIVRLLNDLKKSLKEVEGIEIKVEGNKIVLDGEVLTPNDYGKVANVTSDVVYRDVLSNRIVMSPVSLNALAKKIESDLQVFAQTVRVSVLNGKIILEGSVESADIKNRCAKRAEWYLPVARVGDPINKDPNIEKNDKAFQVIQNDIQVSPPPPKRESKLVRLTVHFVELSKDFLKQFGFKWQPGFTADPSISIGSSATGDVASSGAGGFTFAGTLSSLFPALNSAQSAGYGRVLKSVTAVVKSAEEYHVKDTQQYPTTSTGAQGQTTVGPGITTGLDMKITPTILQGQDVDLNINMSQIDVIGKASNGAPITAAHDIGTRVYLKSGEVSGITSVNNQDVSTSFNRDDPNPGSFTAAAGSAPTRPLWNLMRSKNYTKKRGQFVVFISPQIVESASEGTEDLKKNYRMPAGSH